MGEFELPVKAPPGDTRLRRWFFMQGMDERSGRPRRRSVRAIAWVVFLSMLVAQNPRVRRRRLRALLRFWFCQFLRSRGRTYEVESDGARLVCPPWSALGAVTAATGNHEPDESEFVRRVTPPGAGVVDAGANIGLFALPLASAGAHVLAFEPNDSAAAILEESARRSHVADRVTVERIALSDRDGRASFTTDRDAQNALIEGDAGYGASVEVDVRSLDSLADAGAAWFDAHDLRLLKIDVEGEDERVLRGALGLVDRFRPIVMIEVRDGGSAIRDVLRERGYRSCWYDMTTATLNEFPREWAGNFQFHVNVLAVPDERLAEVLRAVSRRDPRPRTPPVRLHWRRQALA